MPYLTSRDAARFLRGVEVMVIEPELVVLEAGCLALAAEAVPAALAWAPLDTAFDEPVPAIGVPKMGRRAPSSASRVVIAPG